MKHDIRRVEEAVIRPYMGAGKKEGLSFVPKTEYAMLYVDDEPAGFCGLRYLGNRATYRNLYVRPLFRGQGLGATLIRYQISRSREMSMQFAIAYTNPNSLRLYLGCGGVLMDSDRFYGLVHFDLKDHYRVRGL